MHVANSWSRGCKLTQSVSINYCPDLPSILALGLPRFAARCSHNFIWLIWIWCVKQYAIIDVTTHLRGVAINAIFAVIMHMHNMHGPTMVSMAICIYKCIMHLSKTKINPMVQLLLLKSISFIAVHTVSHAQAVLLVSTTRMLMYSYRFALARSSTTYITWLWEVDSFTREVHDLFSHQCYH